MKVYLVQHGDAMQKSENPDRPLTEQGKHDIEKVAALLRDADVQVQQIRHSGKLRAAETAEILGRQLEPARGLIALPGLAPQDDVRPVAELLNRETAPVMLVGHRPFLDRLVSRLVAGDAEHMVLRFQKGGVVCVERERKSGGWAIVWAVIPGLCQE